MKYYESKLTKNCEKSTIKCQKGKNRKRKNKKESKRNKSTNGIEVFNKWPIGILENRSGRYNNRRIYVYLFLIERKKLLYSFESLIPTFLIHIFVSFSVNFTTNKPKYRASLRNLYFITSNLVSFKL